MCRIVIFLIIISCEHPSYEILIHFITLMWLSEIYKDCFYIKKCKFTNINVDTLILRGKTSSSRGVKNHGTNIVHCLTSYCK